MYINDQHICNNDQMHRHLQVHPDLRIFWDEGTEHWYLSFFPIDRLKKGWYKKGQPNHILITHCIVCQEKLKCLT